MATWDPPTDMELAPDKPGKASIARRLRDLFPALAQRASGSPWLNGIGAIEFIRGFSGKAPPFDLVGTWTVPDGVTRIHVTALGAGGSGGPPTNAASGVLGGGGGSGEICERVLEVVPGQVIPVKIGAGGNSDNVHPFDAPGAPEPNVHSSVDTTLDGFNPGDGSRTEFGTPPFHLIARGGGRGLSVGGRAGGAAQEGVTPGDLIVVIDGETIAVPRIQGAFGERSYADLLLPGKGANSRYGGGGSSRPTGLGVVAVVPGAGGSGGVAPLRGGNGANGMVIIRY